MLRNAGGESLLVLSSLDEEIVLLEDAQLIRNQSCVPGTSVLPVGRAAVPELDSSCLHWKFKFSLFCVVSQGWIPL